MHQECRLNPHVNCYECIHDFRLNGIPVLLGIHPKWLNFYFHSKFRVFLLQTPKIFSQTWPQIMQFSNIICRLISNWSVYPEALSIQLDFLFRRIATCFVPSLLMQRSNNSQSLVRFSPENVVLFHKFICHFSKHTLPKKHTCNK